MTAKDITQKVLESIDTEKIMPRPRWHFLLRNIIVWAVGIACVIIGAVAVSVIIFTLTYGAWEVREDLGRGPIGHFISIFPLLWAMLFIIFLFLAEYAVRSTKKGYLYSLTTIAATLLIISIAGGVLLHVIGASQRTDDVLGRHIPHYETVELRQQKLLHHFSEGEITGIIVAVNNDEIIIHNDILDKEYVVNIQKLTGATDSLLQENRRVVVFFDADGAQDVLDAQKIVPMRALRGKGAQKDRPPLHGDEMRREKPLQ